MNILDKKDIFSPIFLYRSAVKLTELILI